MSSCDVLILGGNMPGVITALECAKLGLKVRMVFTELEVSANEVTDAHGGWAWLVNELELPAPIPQPKAPSVVRSVQGELVPVLEQSVLGIPSSPLSAEVVAAIGQSASTRAYFDRIKPVLTIGKVQHLAELVKKRLGDAVLQTLVEPFVLERFGCPAQSVDVAIAVPGLNEAITRTGSLSTAALATFEADDERERVFVLPSAAKQEAAVRARLQYWNVEVVEVDPSTVDVSKPEFSHRALIFAGEPELAVRANIGELGLTEIAVRSRGTVFVQTDAPAGFVGIGETAQGERWSVRLRESAHGNMLAVLAGARTMQQISNLSEADEEPTRLSGAEVAEVLESAGIQASIVDSDSEWSTVCARFTSLEEEHTRNGILSSLNEREAVRVVGSWLYQGDNSEAISAAHDLTQPLRRALLGLQ